MIVSCGLGIGLSVVFGCLLLAFIAELYYLLWWKKRITNIETDHGNTNHADGVIYLGCCNRPSCLQIQPDKTIRRTTDSVLREHDLELGDSKDSKLKTFGEEGIDLELMRLHNLAGPPRFLCTINEETKEDLESEDGKSRGERSRKGSRTRSLSDFLAAMDTPFLSPLASSPLRPQSLDLLDSYKHHGFNPLFESPTELELGRFQPSPPPKFKFLRDAEEKLYRRLMEEATRKAQSNSPSVQESRVKSPRKTTDHEDGSFLKSITNKERDFHFQGNLPHYPSTSSSSQILPLESSPT